MSESPIRLHYKEMRRILKNQLEECNRIRRNDGQATFMREEHEFGRGNVCCLCRYLKKSCKSFSKNRAVCLSCSMKKFEPDWINVENGMIKRWRGSVTQREFSMACGFSQPRLVVLERQPHVSLAVARKVLTGLVRKAMDGADLRQLLTDWPLFTMVIGPDMVSWIASGSEPERPFELGD